ncbi:MAG: ribonuclease III domain-containing protein [Xenococcus sp. MO_188.B8]|nr:ribonuclease III domain-containing protein [Xenococcus sp. MO_188.B8]
MNLPNLNQDQINLIEINTPSRVDDLTALAASITVVGTDQLQRLSPVALAYIGDAVYELFVRTKLLLPPKRIADYHGQVVAQVRAEAQAAHLQELEPNLNLEEKEILRRGRNAVTNKPRRLDLKIYQQASSLETLIGYLYLKDPQRLQDLLTKLNLIEKT